MTAVVRPLGGRHCSGQRSLPLWTLRLSQYECNRDKDREYRNDDYCPVNASQKLSWEGSLRAFIALSCAIKLFMNRLPVGGILKHLARKDQQFCAVGRVAKKHRMLRSEQRMR
jgi:hypothetical protein